MTRTVGRWPQRAMSPVFAGMIAVAAALGMVSPAAADPTAPAAPDTPAPAAPDTTAPGAIERGGRLYDNWFAEMRYKAPVKAHRAYPPTAKFALVPGQTWRCAECHGWDYKGRDGAYGPGTEHYTGIKGVQALSGAEPSKVVAILKDETHHFDDVLYDEQLNDLAVFVTAGQVDMSRTIDPATGKARGDKNQQQALYKTVCVNCHGRDGTETRGLPPLGRSAQDSPQETLHKILFGHPGARMPAMNVLGDDIVSSLLAYLQALPNEEILASVVRGGRLYDNWISESHKPVPKTAHPAFKGPVASGRVEDTWRCKECHGWDYKGRDGHLGAGAPGAAGSLKGLNGAPVTRILAILRDANHLYDGVLDAREQLDVANFVTSGLIDMDGLVNPATRAVTGDPVRHKRYYDAICATCHGLDGRRIRANPPLGQAARANPWNALHKVMNGHPDEAMPPMRMFDVQMSLDLVATMQSLPAD